MQWTAWCLNLNYESESAKSFILWPTLISVGSHVSIFLLVFPWSVGPGENHNLGLSSCRRVQNSWKNQMKFSSSSSAFSAMSLGGRSSLFGVKFVCMSYMWPVFVFVFNPAMEVVTFHLCGWSCLQTNSRWRSDGILFEKNYNCRSCSDNIGATWNVGLQFHVYDLITVKPLRMIAPVELNKKYHFSDLGLHSKSQWYKWSTK